MHRQSAAFTEGGRTRDSELAWLDIKILWLTLFHLHYDLPPHAPLNRRGKRRP